MFLFFWIPKAISGMGVSVLNNIVFLLLFFFGVFFDYILSKSTQNCSESLSIAFISFQHPTWHLSLCLSGRLSVFLTFFALVLNIFLFTVAKIVYFFLVVLKSSFLQVKFVCLTVILLSILAIITAFKSKIPLFTSISGFFYMLWFCCPTAPPSVRLDFGLGSGVDGIMRLVLKSLEALAVLLFFYMVMISMTGQKRQPTTWWCRLKKTHLCVCVHPSVGHITRCHTTSSWQRLVVIMMELHIMMNMKIRRTTTTCCHKFKIMPRCNWVGRRCSTSLLSTSEIIMML